MEVEDPEGDSNPPYPDQHFDLQIRATGLCFPCDILWPDQAVAGLAGGINAISGNKSVSRPDISIGTPGIPLDLTWNYNSVSEDGWGHSYDIRLEDNDISYVGGTNDYKVIRTPAGTVPFQDNGNGYESPLGAPHNHTLDLLTNGNYLATLDGSRTILFDTNGLATALSDAFSNTVTITYTNDPTAGLVVSRVEHSVGLGLDFLYVSGRVDRVLSPSSILWVEYTYDASNRLDQSSRVVNGTTNTTTYSYEYAVDGAGMNLVSMVDPVGHTNVTTYVTDGTNDFSRATASSFGADEYLDVEVEYPLVDALPRTVTRHRDGTDLSYSYQFNSAFREIEAIIGPKTSDLDRHNEVRFELDARGNRIGVIVGDWEEGEWTRTTLAYNDRHQPTNMAFGLYTGSYDDIWTNTPSNVWSYTWDTNFQTIASITDPEDRSIEFDYTNGLISEVRLMVDASNSNATTYSYTTNGLLETVTNANGNAVAYTYDAYGYPDLITPDAGPEIDLDYNVLGHLEKITLPGPSVSPGVPGTRIIDLEPDGLGRVGKITYPNELYETFIYDGVGNLVTNTDAAERVTSYTYEPLGFLSSVTRQLIDATSTQDVTIAFAHDQQFNTLEIEDPLGRTVESYELDELDRAVSVTNVQGQVMSIDYGVGDYVKSIIRFDQSQVAYEYDYDGRLEEAVYSGETNAFTYFRNDLLKTAANSISSVSNGYNSANRLATAVLGVGGLSMANGYSNYPAGQVSNVTSIAGSVAYAYDAAERLTNLNASVAGSFSYTYDDDNGLVKTVAFPNGIQCSFDYDVMDRVTGIDYSESGSELEALVYRYNDATGMITNRTRESLGILYDTRYAYDTLDRLTGETMRDATGAVLDTATYAYDLAGNRTNKTRNGISVTYSLGSGNQLDSWSASGATSAVITVSGSSSETIGTDPRFGERTVNDLQAEAAGTDYWHLAIPLVTGEVDIVAAIGDLAGNVGHATNAITLTIVTNASYGYDAAGNVTNISYSDGDQELGLGWNEQYQLTAVTNGAEVEIYAYDALGRRVATVTGTTAVYHVYDGIHCIADVDAQGELVRSYTYGPGIDNILAITTYGASETNTYYYLTDHLGSVLAITDSDGDVVETYDYDAWGRVQVYDAGNLPLSESGIGNRYTFQGRELSWASGLYYFRARWYDPVTGRWLSKDPIGISGGLNQYVAFANNPVNYSDPYGLWEWDSDVIEWGVGSLLGFHGLDNAAAAWGAVFESVDDQIQLPGEGFDPNRSGLAQIQDSGVSKGWERAYWTAIAVSFTADACALAIGSYEAIALGNQSINVSIQGRELVFDVGGRKFLRLNPTGNPASTNPYGRRPHYHRRPINRPAGPGEGIGRHRPWE